MDGRTEALLYAAARRQHLVEVIEPALKKGKVVICDRFIDSSLAYQGHARGLGIENVLKINEFAIDKRMPDLTVLFEIRPELGLERIKNNNIRGVNRLDVESMKFHNDVFDGYNIVAKMFKKRIVKIDASKSKQDVLDSLITIVSKRLK